jgi:hypothetical protein
MSQQELLTRVVRTLDQLGIGYMVTGSVASSLQGEPRATHDVDLVVAFPAEAAPALVRAFAPPSFYLSEAAIRQAVGDGTMFNLLSLDDGDKVDFWLLTKDSFDQSRFARRRLEEIEGLTLTVSAPEDTILAKLRWAKMAGGSEKQFTDALRVYEVQRAALDHAYLDAWARQLEIEPLWRQLRDAAAPE